MNGGMSQLLEGYGGGGGVRGTTNDHMDELWDDLHLGELLNGLQKENDALIKAKRAAAVKVQCSRSNNVHGNLLTPNRIHFIKELKWWRAQRTMC
jgi:hypothetical protein